MPNNNSKNNKSVSRTRKTINWVKENKWKTGIIISIVIIIIVLAITLPLVLMKKEDNNDSNKKLPIGIINNDSWINKYRTYSKLQDKPPSGNIVCAWSSKSTVTNNYNIVALTGGKMTDLIIQNPISSSMSLQKFADVTVDNFFSKITANFNINLSSGSTKFIVTISNKDMPEIMTFMSMNTFQNNISLLIFMYKCREKGIVGINFDISSNLLNDDNTNDLSNAYLKSAAEIKNIDPNFIVMFSLKLGLSNIYSKIYSSDDLLLANKYDYLVIKAFDSDNILYNTSNEIMPGCNWDILYEIYASKGTSATGTGNCSANQTNFATDTRLSSIIPNKLILALPETTDTAVLEIINELISKYKLGGKMFLLNNTPTIQVVNSGS